MPEPAGNKKHVVYGRSVEDDEDGGARGKKESAPRPKSAGRESLRNALVPLLAGFAMLIALTYGLGLRSVNKLEQLSAETRDEERRLSGISNQLLGLNLALMKLNTEARIRAQVEAGTRGAGSPPFGLRLRNAGDEVKKLLPAFDLLTLRNPEEKQLLRRDVENFIAIAEDQNRYSLEGFPAYRDVEQRLERLIADVGRERIEIQELRYETLAEARSEINFLKWMAVLTGLVVAAATTWEVLRRFRQIRGSLEEIRRERQFSTQMLEGMPSAVAAIGEDDRVRSANAAFFRLFPEARVGASVHGDFARPEAAKVLMAATSKRTSRTTYNGRWRLPQEGDGERTFDVYSSPLEMDGSLGQLLTLVDVTEAARAEQELRQQESLAAVGKAAAQVAHEIKNPLGSIRLGVAMLRDMTSEREVATTIDLVERGIEHLNKLTQDVTQFSRRRQLELSEVELGALLDASLELVADRVREKRTPIEKQFAYRPIRAEWDEDQLRQVFVNLLANAVDASPPESPVNVATEVVSLPAPNRRNGGEENATFARITIADRGTGMDAATRARIFEPFFTTKKKGTGLGLAIAKQIIEQHGGRIDVQSVPGEGTRFTIDLPLSSARA